MNTETKYTSANNNTYSSSSFTMDDLIRETMKLKQDQNKRNNPNGFDKQVVILDGFKPGMIMICRQFLPGTKPVEVGRAMFKEGQNRLSLDADFKGVIAGTPKDETKKFHLEYVNFSDEEIKKFREIEKIANKKHE